MFKQMSQFFENMFPKYQCEFRKCFSTQQFLLTALEKWKRLVDNSKMFDTLLSDLSKAFDFSLTALKLVHNYLSKRKQRTKINSSYSSMLEIILEFDSKD